MLPVTPRPLIGKWLGRLCRCVKLMIDVSQKSFNRSHNHNKSSSRGANRNHLASGAGNASACTSTRFQKVRTAGFEPAISRSPTWRDDQTSLRPVTQCAPSAQWAGRCSNPRLRLFRPPLHHLSYQPKTKNGVRSSFHPTNKKSPLSADTGLTKRLCKKVPERRQKRLGCMGRRLNVPPTNLRPMRLPIP